MTGVNKNGNPFYFNVTIRKLSQTIKKYIKKARALQGLSFKLTVFVPECLVK